jgi:predicted component of type VI protein secretion system
MACRILFRDSEGRSDSLGLDRRAVEIGAAPECQLRISDPSAAPVIARIELRNDYYWIVNVSGDCEIDGKRFDARQLAHNDAVRCGPLWIRFVADHAPAPLRFEPPGQDRLLVDRIIQPPVDLSGSIVSMPSGPDASPPGRRR